MRYVAFDMDGVLVDVDERLRIAQELSKRDGSKDFWDIFFDENLMYLDRPREVVRDLIKSKVGVYGLLIITGRPRKLYQQTLNQLRIFYDLRPVKIYMRDPHDRRPTDILKLELIERVINDGFDLTEYHDDNENILNMVRGLYPHITLYLHDKTSYKVYWSGLKDWK